ncbi:unnamed protein product [Cercospora beticola]|nr:unnamed protein product [Cercospora beticola]
MRHCKRMPLSPGVSRRADYLPATHAQDGKTNLITWETDHDPQIPKNWSTNRKWWTTIVVSQFAFVSPVASTMIAPALESISTEFGVEEAVRSQLMLSVFVLAYAFGPLLFAPLSELYGRRIVLQLGNIFFFAFNLGCGFAQNSNQMIVCRFLAGVGGSVPVSVGGGTVSDIWHPHQRGQAVAIYSFMPLFGPAVGPIAGAFIAEHTTWR